MTDSIFAITATLASVALAIRAFRAVENQSLLAILVGKALWAELCAILKKLHANRRRARTIA